MRVFPCCERGKPVAFVLDDPRSLLLQSASWPVPLPNPIPNHLAAHTAATLSLRVFETPIKPPTHL
jgi:hypothetical protein